MLALLLQQNLPGGNSEPTDIALSNSTVYTTGGLNAVVGTLSAVDPDAGDTFTFALVAGTGDTDNASFNVSGSSLRCSDPSALGVSTRSVRIGVTDSASNTREEAFTIAVVIADNNIRAIIRSITQDVSREITQRIVN